jgi:hypothetical protein
MACIVKRQSNGIQVSTYALVVSGWCDRVMCRWAAAWGGSTLGPAGNQETRSRIVLQCLAQDVGQCTAIRQTRSRPSRRCSPAARGSGNRRRGPKRERGGRLPGTTDALLRASREDRAPRELLQGPTQTPERVVARVSAPTARGDNRPDKAEFTRRLAHKYMF